MNTGLKRTALTLALALIPLAPATAAAKSSDAGKKGFHPFKAIGAAFSKKDGGKTTRIRRTASSDFSHGQTQGKKARKAARDQPELKLHVSQPRSSEKSQDDEKKDSDKNWGIGSGRVTEIAINSKQSPAKIYHRVLSSSRPEDTQVVVDLSSQRAYVKVGNRVAIDTPVSTAKPGKSTPTGTFSITERIRTGKISTIYHAHLPNWMRLDGMAVGFHTGRVPGYPASNGCVRLPEQVARLFYNNTSRGTTVQIRR